MGATSSEGRDTVKKVFVVAILALMLAAVGFAQKPARNIRPARHPNLAAAQRLCQQAYEKITVAQRANEWDMKGHAQKAKELLEQVSNELKEAAQAANANAGR
jgi:hypothetical protein